MGRRIIRTSSQDLKKLLLSPSGGKFFRPVDSFDEVYPGILLGDASTALSTCLLKELKVTHVLNAAHGKNDQFYGGFVNTSFSNYDAAGIQFMGVPALDTPSFYLRSYFKQAADFIDDALRSNGKVLIHCQCGISRSATLIAAYLMLKKGMDVQTALSTIRAHRNIYPNQGFLSQLCDFEYDLKREGALSVSRDHELPPEIKKELRDPSENPVFHPDWRANFTSTNYWPLTRPVSKKGYPISSAYWDYETESRSRARSEMKSPTIYDWSDNSTPTPYHTIRSSSVIPDALYYQDSSDRYLRPSRSLSVPPEESRPSVPLLSSYEYKPYYGSYNYPRTSPEPFYSTPREYRKSLYDPFYPVSSSTSSYDSYRDFEPDYSYSPYLSPYHTRYYSRYYSPVNDSYDDYYYRNPYLDTTLASSVYTPVSLRYPYSFTPSRHIYV